MQVDGAGVQLAERGELVEVLQHPAGRGLDRQVLGVRSGPDVDLLRRILDGRRYEPLPVALVQLARLGQLSHVVVHRVAE